MAREQDNLLSGVDGAPRLTWPETTRKIRSSYRLHPKKSKGSAWGWKRWQLPQLRLICQSGQVWIVVNPLQGGNLGWSNLQRWESCIVILFRISALTLSIIGSLLVLFFFDMTWDPFECALSGIQGSKHGGFGFLGRGSTFGTVGVESYEK
jgi:hypothetical protein